MSQPKKNPGFLKNFRKNIQKRALKIDKRIRLVIAVLILGSILLFSTFYYFDKAVIFLPVIAVSVFILTYFSLAEGINKMGRFGLFLMPEAISVSFYLFYFLFPGRWLTRIPFIFLYEVSIYAVLLCSNIFNVGVEKSLGLYRAAFSINYFYQTVVSFIFFNLLFATKSSFIVNALGTGIAGFLLGMHVFWTIRLKKHLEREVLLYSLFVAVVMFELGLLISFLPLPTALYSLFLTSSYYCLSGLVYSHMDQRLFKETIREYVTVFSFVLIITLLSLNW